MKKIILIYLLAFSVNFVFAKENLEIKKKDLSKKDLSKKEINIKENLARIKARNARLQVRAERKKQLQNILTTKKKDEKTKVKVIPLKGPVDEMLLYFFKRTFKEAELAGVDIIIIDMDTPGGRLDITDKILDLYRNFPGMVYTFINRKAQSAGAILSLGSDGIYMVKGSRIGSAMPIVIIGGTIKEIPKDIHEKMLSDVRSMLRGLAEENGYDPKLAMAFADNNVEVKRGKKIISAKGELLNLTNKESAIIYNSEPLLSDGILESHDALLKKLGVKNYNISTAIKNPSEKLAKMILLIGPLLGILTMLCIYLEINSPGFGVPGIVGVTCFILTAFGYNIAGYANYWEILLIFIGFILIALEIFVIPGFGLPGISGLICLAVGMILMMMPSLPDIPSLPGLKPTLTGFYLDNAIKNMVYIGGGTILGIYLLSKIIQKSSFYNKLLLTETISAESGYNSTNIIHNKTFLHKIGIAKSDLRPAGIVILENERLDVVSTGMMIRKGSKVKVIKIEGCRIVVEEI